MNTVTQTKYRDAWSGVEAVFQEGFCISERGLQSALASTLKDQFPEKKVVIEPVWEFGKPTYMPDIVLVDNMKISDIFELKFVPHSNANFERDIEKLVSYSKCSDECFPVRLDTCTGKWKRDTASLRADCKFHFVAVAQADAAAVWTESLKGQVPRSVTDRFCHWYGRVGAKGCAEWGISFGF